MNIFASIFFEINVPNAATWSYFSLLLAIALFFFCGVACAALGESHRTAQRRARRALISSVNRQEELEAEYQERVQGEDDRHARFMEGLRETIRNQREGQTGRE